MDRRFVALKATDDQETAVRVFRAEDRTALPVTDSAGVLIGIVTVDDVLDVAEAEATEDIQRVGGSEALDEPYMQIAFRRMIQKRAGWLTALFGGYELTRYWHFLTVWIFVAFTLLHVVLVFVVDPASIRAMISGWYRGRFPSHE